MAKYEVMLIVRGDIDEVAAEKTAKELVSVLKPTGNVDMTKHGLKTLAYEIKKLKQGYYFQINFESSDSNSIKEFGRLTRINKQVLRHLVINLEKDYGYKASINEKKIASNKKHAEIYEKVQEELKRKAEERQALMNANNENLANNK